MEYQNNGHVPPEQEPLPQLAAVLTVTLASKGDVSEVPLRK